MCRAGCHYGDLPDLDHYLDALNIPLAQYGDAIAHYLHTEHNWTGATQRVDLHSLDDP